MRKKLKKVVFVGLMVATVLVGDTSAVAAEMDGWSADCWFFEIGIGDWTICL
ncbi:hypothetical protein [Paraburkholderia nodosa]|uniref:hypothetical protein n=1 Tax=Paraburkholderia nodosa TaxID=392320 RepID=UPI00146F9E04|nr:hypothetical protein [Paraburkholderia nodosa]